MVQRSADVLARWDVRRLEIPIPRPTLESVAAPINGAKRRLSLLTAWVAIFAVAGISYAARRRQNAVQAAPVDADATES